MSTLLQLLAEFSKRRGLPAVQVVFASGDDQTLQLAALANEVLEDLHTRGVWSKLQITALFTQTGVEDQGSMDTLAPSGFKWMLQDTFWDRTQRLPVYGPKTEQEWQALKGMPMTGPYLQYRIVGGHLLLNGALIAGHQMAFEYASDWSVLSASSAAKQWFTADTDTCMFPDGLLLSGLNWRWRLEKGLPYAQQFNEYETKVADFKGRDATKPTIDMAAGQSNGFSPGIFVPSGNWPVS
jgi:hypothetical protein